MVCRRDGAALCPTCTRRLSAPPTTRVRGVGRIDALFAYEGTGAEVVRGLKFHDARRVVSALADGLAAIVAERVPAAGTVTWLPTSAQRRRRRGYDQAELLARSVARRLDVPAVAVFDRIPGPPQTGRSWEERADNVTFRVRSRAARLAAPLVVVDDVCTTGATMRAAHDALPPALSAAVAWFALARTP